jgi:hypothetical protein
MAIECSEDELLQYAEDTERNLKKLNGVLKARVREGRQNA